MTDPSSRTGPSAGPDSVPGPDVAGPDTRWQPMGDQGDRTRSAGARTVAADVAWVVGILVVLGLVGGVLWSLLATPAEFTKLRNGGVMSENELGNRFSADGTYVLVAGVLGLVGGVALSWWRSRDAVVTSLALVVGSVLAAALMALTGHLLGPGNTRAALQAAAVGAKVPEQLSVDARTVYLVWPIAVLAGALVVLFGTSSDSDTRSPG